jgi:hypothetical protein
MRLRGKEVYKLVRIPCRPPPLPKAIFPPCSPCLYFVLLNLFYSFNYNVPFIFTLYSFFFHISPFFSSLLNCFSLKSYRPILPRPSGERGTYFQIYIYMGAISDQKVDEGVPCSYVHSPFKHCDTLTRTIRHCRLDPYHVLTI